MIIETERLSLRVASDKEMKDLIGRQSDEILKTAYTEMLDGCIRCPEDRIWYAVWMISLKNGVCVGDLSFKGPALGGAVEIGYGIDEEYRGNGYASEAVKAAAVWAMTQNGVTRVEAETDPENTASQRVLAKAGFTATGGYGEEGPRFAFADAKN